VHLPRPPSATPRHPLKKVVDCGYGRGRLAIDEQMMEIEAVKKASARKRCSVDWRPGQDAVNTAKTQRLNFDGVVSTTDGFRGGAVFDPGRSTSPSSSSARGREDAGGARLVRPPRLDGEPICMGDVIPPFVWKDSRLTDEDVAQAPQPDLQELI